MKASPALQDNKDVKMLDQMFSIVQQELTTNVTDDRMSLKIEDLRSRLKRASYLTDKQRDLFVLKLAELRRILETRAQSDVPLTDIDNLGEEISRLQRSYVRSCMSLTQTEL